jgi:diadenosine tetraphosphatase ApaH/serine/threonine PP2A family protein phosphatase
MKSTQQHESLLEKADGLIRRRQFLEGLAATGAFATVLLNLAEAAEEWEDGDPACRVKYSELTKPEGYELDETYLKNFVGLSEALTGVTPLDRYLAGEFMQRFALHRQLSPTLKKLIDAYKSIATGSTPPDEAAIKKLFWPDPPMSDEAKVLNGGAKQVIYLWYVSAFFLPREDDATKMVWIYGSAEQYKRALLWSVIRAHAPMTPGGKPGHWAHAPSA